jgi:predicted transposase/invertase (TIGR01784 family)
LPKALDREYLTVAFFELKKNNIETTNQRHWRTCFTTGEAPDDAPEYIKKAARIISIDNLEPEEREMINQLEDAQEVYKSTIYTAYLDGKIEGKIEGEIEGEIKGEKNKAIAIARNLLQMGMSAEQVAVATKLSADEVRMLIQ